MDGHEPYKFETYQQQAKRGLLNVLKFIADADDPSAVITPRVQAMVKTCIFEVLRAYFGSNIEKYRGSAVDTLKRILAEVPDCPLKFTDIELRRFVAQVMALEWEDGQRNYDIADLNSAKASCEHTDHFMGIASGMLTPEQDEDSPTSNLSALQEYIKTWADFPAFGFGIPKLDAAIGGIFPSEICVLTGAPGTMKTSLALCAVDDFVTRAERGLVYYCTVDMDAKELSMRLIERETGTPEGQVRVIASSNEPSDREAFGRMWKAVTSKYDGRLVIKGNDAGKARMTWETLKFNCLMRQPQLVVVDYFTCLKAPLQSDLEFVESVMPQVVDFAHEYETCFILLSQMSRASRSEQATGRMGGHGKGGGIVEERAHTEIELTQQPNPDGGAPLVIAGISKARHGQSGQFFSLDYDGPIKKFTGTASRVVKAKSASRTIFEIDDSERGFYDVSR